MKTIDANKPLYSKCGMIDFMNSIQTKLKNIKVIFFDADGVFFDGQEIRSTGEGGEVSISKSRSYLDGQGISFLREMKIKIVFVTGEGEPLNSVVNKINNLPSAKSGNWSQVEIFTKKNSKESKLKTIRHWLKENEVDISEVAYMGDDINDLAPMEEIKNNGGLIICPTNATRLVKPLADIVTQKKGGYGAIREFAEMVIDSRELDEKKFSIV